MFTSVLANPKLLILFVLITSIIGLTQLCRRLSTGKERSTASPRSFAPVEVPSPTLPLSV